MAFARPVLGDFRIRNHHTDIGQLLLHGIAHCFLRAEIADARLATADAVVTPFASPRRLAVHVTSVAPKAADQAVQQKLMPVSVALDANGQATPALLKKLSALGLGVEVVPQLKRAPDGKAEALFLDSIKPGAALAEGLQKALEESLAKLPIPKVMTYQLEQGEGADFQPGWTSVNFVRPAHGLSTALPTPCPTRSRTMP